MKNKTETIENIMEQNKGKIYTTKDFEKIGNKNTVKTILHRLEKENKIERILRGMYVYPEYSEKYDIKGYPTHEEVAQKIAEKNSWTIIQTGECVLNILGLSTQVPNTYQYVHDGEKTRVYEYQGKRIIFENTQNKEIRNQSKPLAVLIEGIIHQGQGRIGEKEIKKLVKFRNKHIKEEVLQPINKIPKWVKEILKEIEERR